MSASPSSSAATYCRRHALLHGMPEKSMQVTDGGTLRQFDMHFEANANLQKMLMFYSAEREADRNWQG